MKSIKVTLDVETYVRCEKAARAMGFSSAEELLNFFITKGVGHTSFASER